MSTHRIYIMNTSTTVKATDPNANAFGHNTEEDAFYILQPLRYREAKGGLKIACSSGGADEAIGTTLWTTYDNGLGHRAAPDHKVVGIVHMGGRVEGTVPARKLPYYVFK